jgi:hypothetical protein
LASPGSPGSAAAADEVRAPWHFKVLLVGLALYLLYRGWQGVDWVIHQVF